MTRREGDMGFAAVARAAFPLLFILSLVTALYWNTLDNDLTYWDDDKYVTTNALVRDISPAGVADIFNPWSIMDDSSVRLTEYLPLTTLTHAIVYHFSGLNPVGYHIANLLLYLADIVLLYYFLSYLIKDSFAAFISTLVFAVHPVHVESVAWVAATKDVLSFLFFIGAMFLYVRYSRGGERRRLFYALSLAVFFAGLLAKSLIVTLPFILILYDMLVERKRPRVLDKIPYFVIGALLSVLYLKVNSDFVAAKYLLSDAGLYTRSLMVTKLLAEYLRMIVFPTDLNAFYAYGIADIPASIASPGVLVSMLVVGAVLAAGVWAWVKGRGLAVLCIFWFFIPFLPVINLVFPSSTLRADRYLFIPSVGFAVLIGWGAARLAARGPGAKKAAIAAVAVIAIAFTALAFHRTAAWQSGVTLWQDSISKKADAAMPHSLLGNEYRHRGMFKEAIAEYEAAVRLDPNYEPACSNLGASYGVTGRTDKAIEVLRACLERMPDSVRLKVNLARGYAASGDYARAAALASEVLDAEPGNADAARIMKMVGR